MNTIGSVTEYNPFHLGHLEHLTKSKKLSGANHFIAVMSGNFVQRGEAAICDKFRRTEMALRSGVDIVIELPVFFATASAEYFARAAVGILNSTGVCDYLAFGSESGEISDFLRVCDSLEKEDPEFSKKIKEELKKGVSYPTAVSRVSEGLEGLGSFDFGQPNNILGVQYVKSLRALKSSMQPLTFKRAGAGYHCEDIDEKFPSATAIRKASTEGRFNEAEKSLPGESLQIFKDCIAAGELNETDNLSRILHYILLTKHRSELAEILDVTEGLENRIINAAKENFNVSDISNAVKTKRYTLTKIKRALLHILLDIKKKDFGRFYKQADTPPYIRVLGFRKEAETLLRDICKKSLAPVITNLQNAEKKLSPLGLEMLQKELYTSGIYDLGLRPESNKRSERTSPVII